MVCQLQRFYRLVGRNGPISARSQIADQVRFLRDLIDLNAQNIDENDPECVLNVLVAVLATALVDVVAAISSKMRPGQ